MYEKAFVNCYVGSTQWLLTACGGQKNAANETEQTAAQQLIDRLDTLLQKGIMYGHQDDPMYGLTWEYKNDSSDVKNVCGDYPAIMGFDLGGIEMGDAKNLDSVPFTRMTEEVKNHYRRGGIVTLSWHPRNPVTTIEGGGWAGQKFPEGTAWDVTDSAVVKKILPGGECHEKFQTWMQRVSDFLATLKTADGQKIPVIFRPWHENSGSWFWWGEKLCTVEEYKALWNMLQDKLKADGFDNLVWSYSPGMPRRPHARATARPIPRRRPRADDWPRRLSVAARGERQVHRAHQAEPRRALPGGKGTQPHSGPHRVWHEKHDRAHMVDIDPAAHGEGLPHQLSAHMAQL